MSIIFYLPKTYSAIDFLNVYNGRFYNSTKKKFIVVFWSLSLLLLYYYHYIIIFITFKNIRRFLWTSPHMGEINN